MSSNRYLEFFAGHPTAANLLMAAFLVLGLISLPDLQRQTFPDTYDYEVRITVPYPGASARDVEQGVCLPMEDAYDSISYLQEMRCDARENLGQMTLQMASAGDFDRFLDDIRSATDSIDDFPDDARQPTIIELGRTAPVVTLALTADLPLPQLRDLAEQLRNHLQQDPQIPLVSLEGFSQRQLRISVDPEQLRRYQIGIDQLASLIQKQNLDQPLGTLITRSTGIGPERQYSLRLADQQPGIDALQQLPILVNANGARVTLGDLARIDEVFENPEDQVRFDGQPAALLRISKNSSDDSLRVLAAVEAFIERELPALPAGSQLLLTQNYTDIIKDRLSMLVSNAWQGLLLVFLTLMLFFGLRYTFWVVMGLPVSFMASFFLMLQLGVSINMMSMVALLLALGLLMDDAIVIAESIAHQRARGLAPLQAVASGTSRVAAGVVSSFLTTVMVFAALLGLDGQLGQVFRVIPIVLMVVLSFSLVEAFLILPHHLLHSLDDGEPAANSLQARVTRWFERQTERLGSALEVAIRYRYATAGFTLLLFFASIGALSSGLLKFNALPEMDGDVLEARLIMPAGTPLAQTEQIMEKIRQALQTADQELSLQESEPLVKHTNIRFGQNVDAFEQGPQVASLAVDLLTAEKRRTDLDTLTETWLAHMPPLPQAASLAITEPALGPAGRQIELRLSGVDSQQLQAASRQLQQWLRQYHGVFNVFDDLRPGKPELALHLRPETLALGLDARSLANQLRTAFAGLTIDTLYLNGQAIDLVVQLDDQPLDLEQLRQLPISLPGSKGIAPLGSLASWDEVRDLARIHRINHEPVVTVYGSLNKLKANTGEVVGDTLKRLLPELQQQWPGLQISVQGELQRSAVTQGSMRSGLLLGLAGVFVLLSLQFRSYSEPLIVMISIPLTLIGVVIGHLLMGQDLSMSSMIGLVSLAGIVVNNAILLVEFVKQHVSEGMDLHRAARQASQDRLRAISLTTGTTVAGLLPLLFETSLQAQVLIPLVISVTFGLLVSTFLVLVLVPCLYSILEDIRQR